MKKLILIFFLLPGLFFFTACEKDDDAPKDGTEDQDNDDDDGGATANGPTMDGHTYSTVVIGEQEWFAENLRTTKYANGDPIPNKVHYDDWEQAGSDEVGAWCHYDHNTSNDDPYGKLYNWYAVNDERNLCPTGWHVPSDSEWMEMINAAGGHQVAGGKLKETGNDHWSSNNYATNEVGFNAVGAGFRFVSSSSSDGNFEFLAKKQEAKWWQSGKSSSTNLTHVRIIKNQSQKITRDDNSRSIGASIRCVKDK